MTLVLLQLAALWPLWGWYAGRLADRSDEPWGLVPLALAAALLWRERRRGSDPARSARGEWIVPALAAGMMGLYALIYSFVPPLVRAGLGVSALAILLSSRVFGQRLHAGLWGLLILSLPVMQTLEFYAGYPLRLLVTRAAAGLLGLAGLAVAPRGTALEWGDALVAVDAPCSGIRMMWAGACLVAALAAFGGLGFGRTVRAGAVACGLILAGNVLRTTALFYVESGLIAAPPAAHAGVGLVTFTLTSVGIVLGATVTGCDPHGGLSGRERAEADGVVSRRIQADAPAGRYNRRRTLALCAFGLACGAAAAAPLASRPPDVSREGFPGWPASFEGRAIGALPIGPVEADFEKTFPGRLGRFSDGEREIVLRWVRRPTRQLHPAETCFKGLGYAVSPRPLERDARGSLWGRFRAERADSALEVRSRIVDEDGREWQDVSSWFWSAALGRSRGPWWAVTVAEAAGRGETE